MRLPCFGCGKSVSTEVPEETIFRAVAFCPECVGRGCTREDLEAPGDADGSIYLGRDGRLVVREFSVQLDAIADALAGESRSGGTVDDPEGTRFVRLSDTLALELERSLRGCARSLRHLAESPKTGRGESPSTTNPRNPGV